MVSCSFSRVDELARMDLIVLVAAAWSGIGIAARRRRRVANIRGRLKEREEIKYILLSLTPNESLTRAVR